MFNLKFGDSRDNSEDKKPQKPNINISDYSNIDWRNIHSKSDAMNSSKEDPGKKTEEKNVLQNESSSRQSILSKLKARREARMSNKEDSGKPEEKEEGNSEIMNELFSHLQKNELERGEPRKKLSSRRKSSKEEVDEKDLILKGKEIEMRMSSSPIVENRRKKRNKKDPDEEEKDEVLLEFYFQSDILLERIEIQMSSGERKLRGIKMIIVRSHKLYTHKHVHIYDSSDSEKVVEIDPVTNRFSIIPFRPLKIKSMICAGLEISFEGKKQLHGVEVIAFGKTIEKTPKSSNITVLD